MQMNIDTPEALAQAIAEQQALIANLGPGGGWVTRRGSIYMLDQEGKWVMRVHGDRPEADTDRIFEAMGWTVVEQSE